MAMETPLHQGLHSGYMGINMIIPTGNVEFLTKAVSAHMADLDRGFDAAEWLANPLNVALTDGRNIGLLECEGSTWQVHAIFEDRGAKALSVGRKMVKIAFDQYRAKVLKGLTPAHCRAARLFTRMLGFTSYGMIETVNGPVELFILERSKCRF